MQFNEMLHKTRLNKGFTAQQMADVLGVSLRAYRFYEAGSREPNLSLLCKLADVLDVTVDYLLCRNIDGEFFDEH